MMCCRQFRPLRLPSCFSLLSYNYGVMLSCERNQIDVKCTCSATAQAENLKCTVYLQLPLSNKSLQLNVL